MENQQSLRLRARLCSALTLTAFVSLLSAAGAQSVESGNPRVPAAQIGATPAPQVEVPVRAPAVSPSEAPTQAPYASLDGTWELQLQDGRKTTYSHLFLKESGDGIVGTWLQDRVPSSVRGVLASDRFTLSGHDELGSFVLSGYEENSAAMIGQLTRAGQSLPFTATHQGGPTRETKASHKARRHRGKTATT